MYMPYGEHGSMGIEIIEDDGIEEESVIKKDGREIASPLQIE